MATGRGGGAGVGGRRHEPVERFDRIWSGWSEATPKPDRIAEHQENRGPYLRAIAEAMGRLPVCRALEVGCGSAIDLALACRPAPHVTAVGLDISPKGLEAARIFARELEVRMALCCADAFALPFPDEAFGLVFSQGVLEHFQEPAAALGEQARVLAGGGWLIASVPQTFTGYTLHKQRAIRRGTWPWGREGQFTAGQLTRLGEALGLETLHVFGCQYWLSWAEPAWVLRDVWGKLHRRNPLTHRFPFAQIARGYDRLWLRLESRFGHRFLLNVVAVFRKPLGLR